MASDSFTRANESPLASPWGSWGSLTTCRLVSNAVQNSSGDGDSGCLYSSSNVASSQWVYISGTRDGGPAVHCATGPDGYFVTSYDDTHTYIFRLDDGAFTQLGSFLSTNTYGTNDTLRLRRSGSDLIYSKNGSDLMTRTDTTYSGTSGSPGAFMYAGNLVLDDFSDGASSGYSLACAQGSYAMTGQETGLRCARRLSASQGSYNLTGQAVILKFGHKIGAAQGTYTLNGQAVTLDGPDVSFSLSAETGMYSLVGSDAVADFAITIGSGSYSLSGNPVGLRYGHKVQAQQGSYALSGQPLAIRVTRQLPLAQGAYALTGQAVALTQHDPTPVLSAQTGLYSLIGNQVGLLSSQNSGEIYHTIPLNWWTKGL